MFVVYEKPNLLKKLFSLDNPKIWWGKTAWDVETQIINYYEKNQLVHPTLIRMARKARITELDAGTLTGVSEILIDSLTTGHGVLENPTGYQICQLFQRLHNLSKKGITAPMLLKHCEKNYATTPQQIAQTLALDPRVHGIKPQTTNKEAKHYATSRNNSR